MQTEQLGHWPTLDSTHTVDRGSQSGAWGDLTQDAVLNRKTHQNMSDYNEIRHHINRDCGHVPTCPG